MNTGGSQFNEWSALVSIDLIWLLCSEESVSVLISQSNRCVSPSAFYDKLDVWQLCNFPALCMAHMHAIIQANTQCSVEDPQGQGVVMVCELRDAELPQCV